MDITATTLMMNAAGEFVGADTPLLLLVPVTQSKP
jgi:hypothetical protein